MPIATFMHAEMAKNRASVIEKERLHKELARIFAQNQTDVFVQTERELAALWIARLEARGVAQAEIEKRFEELTGQALELTKSGFEIAKAHGATAANLLIDGKMFVALANDMRRSGNILGAYRIAAHNGQQYIIFKGYPGLRRLLTGTRYKASNPRIMKLGIGIDAAKGMAKSGTLVTVVISVTLNTIDWIFNEDYGWVDFVGNVSSDVVKAAIASAAGYLTYVGVTAVASVAVVPLGLGIVVGLAVGAGLYLLDRDLQLTEKLIASMTKSFDHWRIVANDPGKYIRKEVDEFLYHIFSEVSTAITREVSRAVKHRLRELTRGFPGYPQARL